MNRQITFNPETLKKLQEGVNIIADAVKVTLGPKGRNVAIQTPYGNPHITKDGVTVAKHVELEDPIQDLAAQIMRQAATKTVSTCGDGPQPLYAKVLTPKGFTTMGKLKVGDTICGTGGTYQTVLEIFPKGEKEIYEVHFSDGRIIECCEDHLWAVTTSYGSVQIAPTSKLLKDLVKELPKYKRYKYYIPNTYVEFEAKEVPIEPYFLGMLIGDGSLSGTGDIELSLGFAKEELISRIPSNIDYTVTVDENKNYFRIKIKGITEQLKELGLFGTKSNTKFIPDIYKYNSLPIRSDIQQGLLATDGYVNNRGRFEFSTVSTQLYNDFVEINRSMGNVMHCRIHTRENDKGSYSDTPIYRVTELKGHKYGNKIVEIKPTGRITKMQCILVSNDDHLYITDNYVVTHNTTTSITLAQALFNEGYKYIQMGMVSPIDLKKGLEKELQKVLTYIDSQSKKIKSPQELEQIATISANNDVEIGKLIAEAFIAVGDDGIVMAEESKSTVTHVETAEGTKFDRGYISPYFMNNPQKLTCELINPFILLYDKKMRTIDDVEKAMTIAATNNRRPLLIIAEEVESQALSALIVNKVRAGLQVCAVKAPGFGDRRIKILEDLAILTKGKVISDKSGKLLTQLTISDLGQADKVVISKTDTVIIASNVDQKAVQNRIDEIKAEIEHSESDYDSLKGKERIAMLVGKVAILRIGAATEIELKEKKDRVDDAVQATKAALKSGIVPGGGTVYFYASQQPQKEETLASKVMNAALQAPIRTICENAGISPDVILNQMGNNKGYNANEGVIGDLIKMGIIDPTLVLVSALENAVSVASMLLLTSTAITLLPEEGPAPPVEMPGMYDV